MYSRVYLEITNICNKNCSFCPGTIREKKMMNNEEFSTIIDKLQGVTEYIYFHLMGEPLLHPLLPEFIKLAKEKGYKPAITTNGTLLKNRGKEIVEAGIYKVSISIHSFEEGTKEEYLSYIENCLNFADYASKNGVLVALRLWNKGGDESRNDETLELMHKKFNNEWHLGTRGARIRDKLHLEYGDKFEWPDMCAEDMGDKVFCYGLKDHFGILCDGRVVPCCLDREGIMTLGNILEEDINEILNSEKAQNILSGFREKQAVEELCRKCGYARRFKI